MVVPVAFHARSLRRSPPVTVNQILHAFLSTRPPLDDLLSVLPPLMPRFCSLANDPHHVVVAAGEGGLDRRLVEMAVTV